MIGCRDLTFLQSVWRAALIAAATVPSSGQVESVPNVIITRDSPLAAGAYAARLPIFFPPIAPVIGTVLDAGDAVDFRYVAPAALGEHIGEWYYPALSTVLAERRLNGKLAERLEAYVRGRAAAEAQLLQHLEKVAGLTANGRKSALLASASEQSAQLETLARDADHLRREFVAAGTAWNESRRIPFARLTKGEKEARRKAVTAQVLLATAFYRDHLTPFQRELLVEGAVETGAADVGLLPAPFFTADRRIMFFTPGTARMTVPRAPDAELAVQIERFERLKAKLRQQLADTATKFDLETGSRAEQAWRTQLTAQSRDLADLDRSAEELRGAFLTHSVDGWPAPEVQWPEDFRLKVEQHRLARATLTNERAAALKAIRDESLAYQPGADGKHLNVKSTVLDLGTYPGATYYINHVGIYSSPQVGPSGKAVLSRMRETMDRLQNEQADRSAALATAEAVLGAEAAKLMRVEGTMTAPQALAVVLRAFAQSAVMPRYALYHFAILEPGLSPNQRRLLLAKALRQLNLALPGGEFQPRDP